MAALKREYPWFKVVGEIFDGDVAKVSFLQGGRPRFDGVDSGIDALFDFPLFYPVRRVFAKGETIRQLPEQLARDHRYVDANQLVTFLGLDDVDRFMNEPAASVAGLKLAFTFLLTTRGIPLIYYGDEIALRGGGDPDNRRDFPGGWPSDPHNAFDAEGRDAEQADIWTHVSRLTRLRAELEPLRRGRLVHLGVNDSMYVYARVSASGLALIALNTAGREEAIDVDLSPLRLSDGCRLQARLGATPALTLGAGLTRIEVGRRQAALYTPSRW